MSDATDFDIVNVTRKVKFLSKSHFLIEGNQLIRNYFFSINIGFYFLGHESFLDIKIGSVLV